MRSIARAVDLVLCVLPFEARFYDSHAVRAVFVNGRQAWDGTAAAPEFGRAGGFGTVLRRTER